MRNTDRLTKILLVIIALFLGVLVGKSLLISTPRAIAQTTQAQQPGTSVLQNYDQSVQNDADGSVFAYRTMPLSTIGISTKDKVRSINVVDHASAFILQFDNRIEVYRIDALNLTDIAARRAAAKK